MNFLAHLHLADNSQTSLAGNLAGDFAKGNIQDFAKPLQQGIWLHRQLDQLTDEHEISRDLIRQFPKKYSRIAPVLMDLAFDHMLARYWDEYHGDTLEVFTQRAYEELAQTPDLPEKLSKLVPVMRQQNWLLAYESRTGLNDAILGVGRRFSKPELFVGADKVVKQMDTDIEIAFRTLYPQLMAYSRILSRKTPDDYL
ncbi:ACP phosphodiesterase [Shewanella sp. GXUN23E]|uniref:acyl carrier protein phosphodiesterase n=1 Tax=Shewanella sp. GXUN23E TaxID=3422498 RepID=UPI003D7D3297